MSKKKKNDAGMIYHPYNSQAPVNINSKNISVFQRLVGLSVIGSNGAVHLSTKSDHKFFKKHKELFKFFYWLGKPMELAYKAPTNPTEFAIRCSRKRWEDIAKALNAKPAPSDDKKESPEVLVKSYKNLDGEAITIKDIAGFNTAKECWDANLEHLIPIIEYLYDNDLGLRLDVTINILGKIIQVNTYFRWISKAESPAELMLYIAKEINDAIKNVDDEINVSLSAGHIISKCIFGYITALIKPNYGTNSFLGRKFIPSTNYTDALPIYVPPGFIDVGLLVSYIKFNNCYVVSFDDNSEEGQMMKSLGEMNIDAFKTETEDEALIDATEKSVAEYAKYDKRSTEIMNPIVNGRFIINSAFGPMKDLHVYDPNVNVEVMRGETDIAKTEVGTTNTQHPEET